MNIPAVEALQRLREGNQRFASGTSADDAAARLLRRAALVTGQEPFAIILGCSDSRVPAEIVFDQGLGDLFVIRVAGNIVAPSQIGSVEFAAEQFGTRLVVVLGHTQCGAVRATLDALRRPEDKHSRNLRSIVNRILPAVEGLALPEGSEGDGAWLEEANRANVRAATNQLRRGSPIIEKLVGDDGLLVVGAQYSLETGVVEFLEDAATATGAGRAVGMRSLP